MARKKQETTITTKSRKRSPAPTPSLTPEREPWTPWGKWAKQRRERIEQKRREKEERRRLKIEARRRRQLRRRKVTARGVAFLGLFGVACGVAFLVLSLLGRPYPWEAVRDLTALIQASGTLEERQARWDSLAVRSYRVDITYVEGTTQCGPATLEVRDGLLAALPPAGAQQWSPAEVCNALAEQLLIDGAFSWLEQEIQGFEPGQSYLRMQFHPDFGYPTYAEAGVYQEEDRWQGCCWRVTWGNLLPINE